MSFTPEQIKMLTAPLDRANVKSRQQGGGSVSYIEAYHAENEANRIFGFGEWDRETELTYIDAAQVQDKWRVYYRAKVKITVRAGDGVVVREGCGFGSGIDRDLGQAHESALKEAESDAEKRALKTFGNPFGQALYDKTQANVADAEDPAATFAIDQMRSYDKPEDFKEFWEKNRDGLKQQLTAPEYARVVTAMRERAKELAPTPKPTETAKEATQ